VEQDPAYDGKIVESLSYDKHLETHPGISTAQTVGVIYKSNLNTTAGGKYNTEALKVDIYAVYNTVRDGVDIERAVKLTASIQDCQCCGAFTVDGQWLNFMCHNLGADENLNPFEWSNTAGGDNAIDNGVPDGVAGQYKDIKGWLFQWGRKADGHQYRNSTTSDVPSTLSLYRTSPSGLFYINSFDWITDGNTDEGRKRWGDGTDNANPAKAPDDPCPAGWKVPSIKQLYSIFKDNVANDTGYSYNIAGTANVWTPTGTWTPGSGSGGYKVGDALYLPATGQRTYEGGMGAFMGAYGYYWGSTLNTNSACFLYFNGNTVYPNYSFYQTRGHSVRCVSE
jgi:uncharacterized protein (TIGR02145 family)